VVRAVGGLIDEQDLATKRAIRLYAEINQFLDQVLVSTVQAYESAGADPDPRATPRHAEGIAALRS
jgi:hypothetical protein